MRESAVRPIPFICCEKRKRVGKLRKQEGIASGDTKSRAIEGLGTHALREGRSSLSNWSGSGS